MVMLVPVVVATLAVMEALVVIEAALIHEIVHGVTTGIVHSVVHAMIRDIVLVLDTLIELIDIVHDRQNVRRMCLIDP